MFSRMESVAIAVEKVEWVVGERTIIQDKQRSLLSNGWETPLLI